MQSETEAAEKSSSIQSFSASFLSGLRYEHLIAGLTGGVLSTLITHPFDLIKLRFAGKTLV